MIWRILKFVKIRWIIGFAIILFVYSAIPINIEMEMAKQFVHNINPEKYSQEGLLLPYSKHDLENSNGIYQLSRFFEAYLIGEVKEDYLTNAEWWFHESGNQKVLNYCWQLRSFIKFDEPLKLKLSAENNLAKWRPYYGEDITIKYYAIATSICLFILLLTFSVELKPYFSKFNVKKESEKINY
jgi:hypothetical protein